MSNYAFVHDGVAFGPSGKIQDTAGKPLPAVDADSYNKALEAQEIQHIKAGAEHLFLYVCKVDTTQETMERFIAGGWNREHVESRPQHYKSHRWEIHTWLGTALDANAYVGPAYKTPAFGWPSVRRAVTCRIFGVLYHGTYYESSGDYCRLRRAKRQGKGKGNGGGK